MLEIGTQRPLKNLKKKKKSVVVEYNSVVVRCGSAAVISYTERKTTVQLFHRYAMLFNTFPRHI